MKYPERRIDWLGGRVNTSEAVEVGVDTSNMHHIWRTVCRCSSIPANARCRSPLHLPFIEAAVRDQIVGKLSKIMEGIRVQNTNITYGTPNIASTTRAFNSGFQNLQVEPCAFRQGEDAGVQAILTLGHLHTGSSIPRTCLTPVAKNPHGTTLSHRCVGDGDRKALIRRVYAFGMVMYWVCAG